MTTEIKIPPQPKDDAKADTTKTSADLKKAEASGAKTDKAPRGQAAKGDEQGGQAGAGVHGIAPNANPSPGLDPQREMRARSELQEAVAVGANDAMAGDAELNQLGDGVTFDEVSGPNGRTITISKKGAEGPTITREVTVKHDAKPEEIAAAKSRLIKQFIDA